LANASELIRKLSEQQEIMALLKILALGNRQIEEEKVRAVSGAIQAIREHRKHHR